MPTLKECQIPESIRSKSAELLERAGYTRKSSSGIYNYLPMGQMVLDKLITAVDEAMQTLEGSMRVKLAHLQPRTMWDHTGRADLMGDEMFKCGTDMVLAPTHEEEITSLVASLVSSYKQLPLRLYQIGEKFRNEARPRGGLLRCREFVMKDLYTFDRNEREAQETYDLVCEAYRALFSRLGLKTYQAQASSGAIGGSRSHEFHIECPSGQDSIYSCNSCDFVGNQEVLSGERPVCPKCSASAMTRRKGLEIGHAFLLGSKYSSVLNAKFKSRDGTQTAMEMGCFGIGVSRLMAAIVEASHDENGIVWPVSMAPFDNFVIPLVDGTCSVEGIEGSCLLDDRPSLSYSHKFKDALLSGIPNIIVLGGKRAQVHSNGKFEHYTRIIGGVK